MFNIANSPNPIYMMAPKSFYINLYAARDTVDYTSNFHVALNSKTRPGIPFGYTGTAQLTAIYAEYVILNTMEYNEINLRLEPNSSSDDNWAYYNVIGITRNGDIVNLFGKATSVISDLARISLSDNNHKYDVSDWDYLIIDMASGGSGKYLNIDMR